MARLSAALLCTSSLVLLLAAPACSGKPRPLTQQQLEDPARVAAWLTQHGAAADKARAQDAHQAGMADLQRGDLGSALKGLGLSAILYPTPQALAAYADTVARFTGSLREQRKDRPQHAERDLASIEALYRSALASQAVLPVMSAEQLRQTRANAECVAAFRRKEASAQGCAPLKAYGLK